MKIKSFKINNFNNKESLIIFSLYILGLIHWYLFLNFKNDSFEFHDWKLFFGIYLVFDEGFKNFQIPYHASIFSTDNFYEGNTRYIREGRFFANEWIPFMPQSILLFFINAKHYLTLQYLLFYSLLFYGLVKISKSLELSITATIFLIILSTYNGKLISQTAFGEPHFVFGWMMVPIFYWYIYNFLKKELKKENFLKEIIKFSLIFFFILSQADMHIYYEIFVVGFLITLFFPKKLFIYLTGFLLSVVTSLWYVLPVLFYSNKTAEGVNVAEDHWRRYGINGYGHENGYVGKPIFDGIDFNSFNLFTNNITEIFINIYKYLINIFNHIFESLTVKLDAFHYNTHEYNIYVSIFGLILLFMGILYSESKNNFIKKNKFKIIFPIFLVFLLSIGPFHKLILKFLNIFLEFNPIDGVPSRFMIFVLYFFIIVASLGFDKIFEKFKIKSNFIKYFSLLVLLLILWLHSYDWWLFNSRSVSVGLWENVPFDIKIFSNPADKSYINLVNFSYIFSLLSIIILFFTYKKLKK